MASENLTMKEPIGNYNIVLFAFFMQWFSLVDCMDGMRARRTKCGSPLGRIIDEGIDQIAYTAFGAYYGYVLRVEPGI